MGHSAKKSKPKVSYQEKRKAIRKERKEKLKGKRAKLVIRNLPFNATVENLKEHFEKYGEIGEIKILKREDGKLVGCGFVQFNLVQKAAKARHHTNGKPFLGRDILVDFALAKDKFLEKPKEESIKEENDVKFKDEPLDTTAIELKEESVEEGDDEEVEEIENCDDDDEPEASEDESLEEEEEGDEISDEITENKPRYESNDVTEGRTVFVKNVPFTATNDDLKECMKQFGPVFYALICIDKYTEHSKGTAFVKFVNADDAEKALSAGTELTLQGNVLDCHKALGRGELQGKSASNSQKSVPKDSRNLYLVKEGVILAGTKAAEGVSATDMAKRLQLEQYKTQMLRNLNMFVSRERLVVHNLPSTWDDKKFRELIKNNSPKNAVIKEARIMRNMKNVDADGVGLSKEFGFVSFNRHDDALTTLRNLNNNPKIFSAHRRPIVTFSIESKTMLRAKQKRLEKSRVKNPKCKQYDPEVVAKETKEPISDKSEDTTREKFVGVAAKPGVQKMRSRYNLKTQAKLHYENMKKEKKKQKFAKKSFKEKQQEFTKQPKQKLNKKNDHDDQFSKMVNNYKKNLLVANSALQKSKWYQE